MGAGVRATYADRAVPLFSRPAKPADAYDVTGRRDVDPRRQPDNFEKNVEAVGKLGDLAAAKGITVSQPALALARGEHAVPIPAAGSVQRTEENAGPVDVSLTGTDLAATGEILPHDGFSARYCEDHAGLDPNPRQDPSRPS